MTPFAIVGTVYLILLAICFAVSAVSLAVIAWKTPTPVKVQPISVKPYRAWRFTNFTNAQDVTDLSSGGVLPTTSWPTKNGASVEHGEG